MEENKNLNPEINPEVQEAAAEAENIEEILAEAGTIETVADTVVVERHHPAAEVRSRNAADDDIVAAEKVRHSSSLPLSLD